MGAEEDDDNDDSLERFCRANEELNSEQNLSELNSLVGQPFDVLRLVASDDNHDENVTLLTHSLADLLVCAKSDTSVKLPL